MKIIKSRHLLWPGVSTLLMLIGSSTAQAAFLDPTFDGDGRQFVNIGQGTRPTNSQLNAIATQKDGKIVVAGYAINGKSYDFLAMRLNANGTLDGSFGDGGRVFVDAGSGLADFGNALAVQKDGKIVLGGSTTDGIAADFVAVRLNVNGTLDKSFSGDGIVQASPGIGYNAANALAVQPDGKILVTGEASNGSNYDFAAVRLTANGSFDNTFSGNGKVLVKMGNSDDYANAVTLQRDGKIILAGSASQAVPPQPPPPGPPPVPPPPVPPPPAIISGSSNFSGLRVAAARLNADGSLDTSFEGDGKVVLPGAFDFANGAAVQNDGKIVLAGYSFSNALVVRLNSDGSSDRSFSGGRVELNFNGQGGYFRAVALQSDGKILLGGSAKNDNPNDTSTQHHDFVAVRLNPNGTLNTSFNGTGIFAVTTPYTNEYAQGLALQSDGKILLAGVNSDRGASAVARVRPNGTLDPNFANGLVSVRISGDSDDYLSDMAVQSDGKILLVGSVYNGSSGNFVLSRLNPDGSLDTSFSEDGKLILPFGPDNFADARSIALQRDGKILVAGNANNNFAVMRINPDGTFDSSFDGDGRQILLFGYNSTLTAMVLQSDGKVVLSGSVFTTNGASIAVVQLNTNGSLDTNFDGDGAKIFALGAGDSYASDVARQSNGKIVVVGSSHDGSRSDFVAARLNRDGSFDTTFSGDGLLRISLTVGNGYARAVTLQSDGKILIAGSAANSLAAARLNPNGTLDTSFSEDGKLVLPQEFFAGSFNANDVAMQSDGKIVLGGLISGKFAAVRLHANGSADEGFGPDGLFAVQMGGFLNQIDATSLELQDGDKILLGGYAYNETSQDFAVARIVGHDPALVVENARTADEGDASAPRSATFTVTLQEASTQTVTVDYSTADDTAKAGSDYVSRSGTLTFAPGETTKFVKINFIGDSVAEADETFFLDLKSPTHAALAPSRGSALIQNDDGPGLFIANATPIDEGNGGARTQAFRVTLSQASSVRVTVDWSTANDTAGPTDYVAASGTLRFTPGETSKTILVNVKGDTLVEPTETYKVTLARPTYAVIEDSQGVGAIRNDDSPPVSTLEDAPSQ